jgi:hypothetical protein
LGVGRWTATKPGMELHAVGQAAAKSNWVLYAWHRPSQLAMQK